MRDVQTEMKLAVTFSANSTKRMRNEEPAKLGFKGFYTRSQTIRNLELRLYRSKTKLGFKSGRLKVAAFVAHVLGADVA